MKFSVLSSAALFLAFSKFISCDSEQFGLVSIRSGTSLQYASVYVSNGKLYLGSSSASLSGTITDDGLLLLSDSHYATFAADGSLVETTDASEADKFFSISDGYLAYSGIDGFNAIPEGSAYYLATSTTNGTSSGVIPIALKAIGSNGQSVPDFTPAGKSNTTSTATETSSQETSSSTISTAPIYPNGTATTTKSDESTTVITTTTCSGHSDCTVITSTPGVSSNGENGAAVNGASFGAGVLAIAALLI
ncbi:Cwp1p SCDLUD_004120 [Saccharomycodes ludwigii]|uniref:Cwp1p n=1 Tax=Saccharomycodes ludwigii TaxID=36035 RepID=UPI001E830CB9|nr:hypothetical protein SCDLUD_004120 [Saccharomycodes ludwigii]KAH3899827.1 hypothetical protein SCDLUD_004120 [Saccharomycodes ludwigii]